MEAGLCMREYYEFSLAPVTPDQEKWTPTCFVCRAVAKNLEVIFICLWIYSRPRYVMTLKINRGGSEYILLLKIPQRLFVVVAINWFVFDFDAIFI